MRRAAGKDLEKGRRRHLPPVVGVRPGGDEDSPVSRDDSDSGWEGRENQREEEENSGRQLEPSATATAREEK